MNNCEQVTLTSLNHFPRERKSWPTNTKSLSNRSLKGTQSSVRRRKKLSTDLKISWWDIKRKKNWKSWTRWWRNRSVN